jgi:hypothetical protein
MFLLLFVLQFVHATEKDSIHYRNRFAQYILILILIATPAAARPVAAAWGFRLCSTVISSAYGISTSNTKPPMVCTATRPGTAKATIPRSSGRVSLFIKTYKLSALVPYTTTRAKPQPQTNRFRVWAISRFWPCTGFSRRIATAFLAHTWQVGGGVKLPTGKYNTNNNGSVNPSFQLGTGSWDYLLATEYIVRRKQFGLNTMLNYVIKTENGNGIALATSSIMPGLFLAL